MSRRTSKWGARREAIEQALDARANYRQLGDRYGVTRERIRQVVIELGVKSAKQRDQERALRLAGRNLTIHIPAGRVCARCGEYKLFSEFSPSKTGRHGRDCYCRPCKAAYARCRFRERYQSEPEFRARVLERNRQARHRRAARGAA